MLKISSQPAFSRLHQLQRSLNSLPNYVVCGLDMAAPREHDDRERHSDYCQALKKNDPHIPIGRPRNSLKQTYSLITTIQAPCDPASPSALGLIAPTRPQPPNPFIILPR